MKFVQNNSNVTYANPLTLQREQFHFEIHRFSDKKVAFTNRRPRKGSKFWSLDFLVWNLKENCQA